MSAIDTQLLVTLPRIEVGTLSSPLVRDYLAGASQLAPFFSGHPLDPGAYLRKAAEVERRLTPAMRARVAPALRPLSEGAEAKLRRIVTGEGFFVTTGQQTGLFTGPLYTIYKALSAIRLAQELEALLQRPVLALFWSAADDHDWDEVRQAAVLDANEYVERVGLAADTVHTPPFAMSHRTLGPTVRHAADALGALLPDSPYRDVYLAAVRQAYVPGNTVADAFEEVLAAVLLGLDIALVSSAHALVKRHASPIIERALERAAEDAAAVAAQTERLVRAGYPAQVSVAAGASNVFLLHDGGRDRLVAEQGGWSLRRSRRRITAEALRAQLLERPETFSPNVLLRPVVESSLFPTLAYVGGPAETSYFAQIGCLFEMHGIMPPLVFPRHSITLVEPRVQRLLDRTGLTLADVQQPLRALVGQFVAGRMPAPVLDALEGLRASLRAGYQALREAAVATDANLAGPLARAEYQALAETGAVEKKIAQHVRRLERDRLEQVRRAAAHLQPDDAPQERVLNVLPYLARYGPALLQGILGALPLEFGPPRLEYGGVRCNGDALAPPSPPGIA